MPPKIAPKGSKTVAQKRKKSEQKGCGGTLPEALNKLLEPLEDGSKRFGLACCVARGVIKYGSLRCLTEEKLGDYVSRGTAVYEHLGPKSKPHVDFVQRLQTEMKVKNLSRYFYSSMCRWHLDNVTSLLQRVEKKLRTADPKSGNDSTPVSESKMADPPDDGRKHIGGAGCLRWLPFAPGRLDSPATRGARRRRCLNAVRNRLTILPVLRRVSARPARISKVS